MTANVTGHTGDARARSWLLPATALGVVLLSEVLRVWLPSVIFVYGRAGSTPATQMGLFAAVWFLLVLPAVPAVRFTGARALVAAGAAGLVVARLVLQGTNGGDVQLYAASVALLAGLVWLVGLAAGAPSRRDVGIGVVAGLAAFTALQGGFRGVETVWFDGVLGWVIALVLASAFAATTVWSLGAAGWWRPGDGVTEQHGPAWPWLLLGPVLVLSGIVAGVPSRFQLATDAPEWVAAGVVVAAHVAAVWLAWDLPARLGRTAALLGSLLVLVGTALGLGAAAPTDAVGQVLLALGLGLAIGAATQTAGSAGAVRRAGGLAGGLVLLLVLAFLYYSAYDFTLGVENWWLIIVAGVLVAALLLAARPAELAMRSLGRSFAGAGALAVMVVVGAVALQGGAPAVSPGDGFPVRVMIYNVHMGFDTAGRFDLDALADVVAAQDPDVVVLNEVDRGWLLNGTNDVLPAIAEELGMTYRFAPAADDVWGNAILSRMPVSQVETRALPQGGAPMARSVISLVVDLGGDAELGVVGTHLHHVEEEGDIRRPQAAVVAEVAQGLAGSDGGRPVVVMGDLNAAPGATELEPLAAALDDALAPFAPIATFPSWDPDRHIDHILVTADLTADDVAVPRSEASDHLGVAVTLRPAG